MESFEFEDCRFTDAKLIAWTKYRPCTQSVAPNKHVSATTVKGSFRIRKVHLLGVIFRSIILYYLMAL